MKLFSCLASNCIKKQTLDFFRFPFIHTVHMEKEQKEEAFALSGLLLL